jgi:uncharacterized protein (TIGR00266 family)
MPTAKRNRSSSSRTQKQYQVSRKVKSVDITNFLPEFNGIPAAKIYNSPSNGEVVLTLEKGQSVFMNGSTMIWMDADIKVNTQTSGFFAGLRRTFTGDSLFLTYFTGVSPKGNKICFAPHLPGDVTKLIIKPGQKRLVSTHSIICCTSNVKLDVVIKMRGFFTGQPFLSTVTVPADSKEPGVVWIGSFGSINTFDIKAGEKYQVENHNFLACDGSVDYTLGTLGGLKSTFLSGEGIVMNFTGPCSIMVQNRKIMQLAYHLKPYFKQ